MIDNVIPIRGGADGEPPVVQEPVEEPAPIVVRDPVTNLDIAVPNTHWRVIRRCNTFRRLVELNAPKVVLLNQATMVAESIRDLLPELQQDLSMATDIIDLLKED